MTNRTKEFQQHFDEWDLDNYQDDIQRIINILESRGYADISQEDVAGLWAMVSNGQSAGWLILSPNDDHVFLQIYQFTDFQFHFVPSHLKEVQQKTNH